MRKQTPMRILALLIALLMTLNTWALAAPAGVPQNTQEAEDPAATQPDAEQDDAGDGALQKDGSGALVIYVDGSVTSGNGATPETAVQTLDEAYDRIQTQDGKEADAILVICGDVQVTTHFNYDGTKNHTGTYTITSQYKHKCPGILCRSH